MMDKICLAAVHNSDSSGGMLEGNSSDQELTSEGTSIASGFVDEMNIRRCITCFGERRIVHFLIN